MQYSYKIYCFFILAFIMLISSKEVSAFSCHEPEGWDHTAASYVKKDTIGLEIKAHALDKKAEPLISLYPNPSFGPVTLFVKDDRWQGGTASVYNIIGQLIVEKPIDNIEIDFDLSSQRQGIYLVTLRNGNIRKTLRLERRM